jgi:hypothetical protein
MNIYLPEERFVEQVPGDVFDDGSVAGEDGLGIDNLKKMKKIYKYNFENRDINDLPLFV